MLADDLQKDPSRVFHDQSQALILGLPLEIRHMIWTLVFEAREDDVGQISRERYEEHLFEDIQEAITEDLGYSEDEYSEDGEETQDAHNPISSSYPPDKMFGSYFDQYAFRSIALLLTCRKIYLETYLLQFQTNGLEIHSDDVDLYTERRTSLVARGRLQANDTYLDYLIRRLDPTQLAAISTLHFIPDEDCLDDEDLATPVLLCKKGFEPTRIRISIALQGQMSRSSESWYYQFQDPFRKMERNSCVFLRPGSDDWDTDWPWYQVLNEAEENEKEEAPIWPAFTDKYQLYSSVEELILEFETPFVEKSQIDRRLKRAKRWAFRGTDLCLQRLDESKTTITRCKWPRAMYRLIESTPLRFDKNAALFGSKVFNDRACLPLSAATMPDRYVVTLHFRPTGEETMKWKERHDIQVARNLEDYETIRRRSIKKMMKQRRIYEHIHAMSVKEQKALVKNVRTLSYGQRLALLEEAIVVPRANSSGGLVITQKKHRALQPTKEDELVETLSHEETEEEQDLS